jgi:AcrR family transcriptional regulator
MASRRRRDTPGRILEAAADLFTEKGYHGTSMRQIARRAGVVPAAIYNHYPSKEKLFLTVFRERVPPRALAGILQGVEGESVEALLRNGLQQWRSAVVGQTSGFRLVFVELLEFKGKHIPPVAGEFIPRALAFIERLQQSDGRLRPLPPMLALRAIGGVFMSYAITQAFFSRLPGFADDPQALDGLADILLHGLLPESRAGGAQ